MLGGKRAQALVISGLGIAVALSTAWRLLPHQETVASQRLIDLNPTPLDVFSATDAHLPPIKLNTTEPSVSAKAVAVYDLSSGYFMHEENTEQAVPIASTTKLMTAIIALEQFQLEEIVNVTPRAVSVDGSKIQLRIGESISVEALLKGLLIQSGNDTAYALAEHMGYEQFLQAMNEKAQYLGLTGTHYADPSGLDDSGYSTARDLAILAAYALRFDVIRGIVRMPEASVFSADGSIEHRLQTSNRLIKNDHPLFMHEVTGLKTGFTYAAGHCLVASATRDGKTVVSVVLSTTEDTPEASAKESYKALHWAFANHRWD